MAADTMLRIHYPPAEFVDATGRMKRLEIFAMVEAAGIEPASWMDEGRAPTSVVCALVLASRDSRRPDSRTASPLDFPRRAPGQGLPR